MHPWRLPFHFRRAERSSRRRATHIFATARLTGTTPNGRLSPGWPLEAPMLKVALMQLLIQAGTPTAKLHHALVVNQSGTARSIGPTHFARLSFSRAFRFAPGLAA
jgi:hypothetical protein